MTFQDIFTIRTEPGVRCALKDAADQDGVTVPVFVRNLIGRELRERQIDVAARAADTKSFPDLPRSILRKAAARRQSAAVAV